MCVSDNDSAIVEPTQPTELKCEHLLCPILEKQPTELKCEHFLCPTLEKLSPQI